MSRARPEGSELLQATAAGVPTRAINMLVFLGELRTARLDSRFKQAQAGQLYSQIVTEAWGASLQIYCTRKRKGERWG